MKPIFIPAHFDGERIVLDESVTLPPNARLLVTILPDDDQEREEWIRFSMQQLEKAYGDDEPEYTLDMLKEVNPDYRGP